MAHIFKATFDELKQKLRPLGLPETWEQRTPGIWMVRVQDGTVLHWAPKKGTYWCKGQSAEELLVAVRSCLNDRAACYKLIVEGDESVLPCNDLIAALREMGCNAMRFPHR